MDHMRPGKHSMRLMASESIGQFSRHLSFVTRHCFLLTSLFLLVTCHSSLVTVLSAQGGGPPDADVLALAIDPSTPSTLYAGTNAGGVFKSINGASTWTAVNSGLTSTTVNALAIDPSTPATLYAGTFGGGVFKSTNGGTSWTAANSGLTDTRVLALAIDPSTPATLYAGTFGAGVFKSINGGTTWQPTGATLDIKKVRGQLISE